MAQQNRLAHHVAVILVEIVFVLQRRDEQRGVSNASSNYHVGVIAKGLDDAFRAKVYIGRQYLAKVRQCSVSIP